MSVQRPHPLVVCKQQADELIEEIQTHGNSYGIRQISDLSHQIGLLKKTIYEHRNANSSRLYTDALRSLQKLVPAFEECSARVDQLYFNGSVTRNRSQQCGIAKRTITCIGAVLKESTGPLDRFDGVMVDLFAQVGKQMITDQGSVPQVLSDEVDRARDDVLMYVG